MVKIEKFFSLRYLNEKAQGIVEYALVLAFVAVVATALGTNGQLTQKVKGAFDSITAAFAVNETAANSTSSSTDGNN
ncbi:MAG: pilin protein [Selenomonas sp.]|uniref:Flp family type IVb pilin n=1 Tax=Selenomonas sp. TaxID=2053611 RepID=UPI0025DFDB88|nr:pilin protein [Selenomonas sp.]MCR5758497.1 pilin protein [Selenomonas sp.]